MKKYRWNAKKCFGNLATLGMVAILGWAIISWVQICLFNTNEDPFSHYSWWNLWTMLVR